MATLSTSNLLDGFCVPAESCPGNVRWQSKSPHSNRPQIAALGRALARVKQSELSGCCRPALLGHEAARCLATTAEEFSKTRKTTAIDSAHVWDIFQYLLRSNGPQYDPKNKQVQIEPMKLDAFCIQIRPHSKKNKVWLANTINNLWHNCSWAGGEPSFSEGICPYLSLFRRNCPMTSESKSWSHEPKVGQHGRSQSRTILGILP